MHQYGVAVGEAHTAEDRLSRRVERDDHGHLDVRRAVHGRGRIVETTRVQRIEKKCQEIIGDVRRELLERPVGRPVDRQLLETDQLRSLCGNRLRQHARARGEVRRPHVRPLLGRQDDGFFGGPRLDDAPNIRADVNIPGQRGDARRLGRGRARRRGAVRQGRGGGAQGMLVAAGEQQGDEDSGTTTHVTLSRE